MKMRAIIANKQSIVDIKEIEFNHTEEEKYKKWLENVLFEYITIFGDLYKLEMQLSFS